jgi:hypothetical protein
MDKNGIIDSQEEYDKELKKFQDKIKSYNEYQLIRHPSKSLSEIMQLFNDAEKIGLFPSSYCQEQRTKIIEGINSETKKEQIKEYLRKKGLWKK